MKRPLKFRISNTPHRVGGSLCKAEKPWLQHASERKRRFRKPLRTFSGSGCFDVLASPTPIESKKSQTLTDRNQSRTLTGSDKSICSRRPGHGRRCCGFTVQVRLASVTDADSDQSVTDADSDQSVTLTRISQSRTLTRISQSRTLTRISQE